MPFTFTAYTIAAVSIIGLPPMVGSWSKWFLIDGAVSADHLIIAGAFLLSTVLNIIYLLPIATNGFLLKPDDGSTKINEAPFVVVIPLCVTAALCLVMFFFMPVIYKFLN